MPENRTCFVISPIGEPGSDTRSAADDFFDLIVQPAVEKFGFTVVRADKIARPGSITEAVLRLVHESAWCIVDLTGHNPNVFYECGRRHETGRPCIQLVKESEDIPFDLSDLRTIRYQLDDPRAIWRTVKDVQAFVAGIEESGFSAETSTASMSAIAKTLSRIERRLLNIESARQQPSNLGTGQTLESLFQNPLKAMQEAMIRGDLSALVELLPQLESTMGVNDAVMNTASIVAIKGYTVGAEVLWRALSGTAKLVPTTYMAAVGGLVQYYVARNEEKEGCELMKPMVEAYLLSDEANIDRTGQAFLYNQLSILQYGAGAYADGLASLEKATELNPDERSYWYNISIIYDRLSLPDKACDAAHRSIADLESPDVDHLAHAIDVYSKTNRPNDAEQAMNTLARIDPKRAEFIAKV